MTSPESLNSPLVTADQALKILHEVGTLTTLDATHRGQYASTYELKASGAPPEVTAHFPEAESTSLSEAISVTVLQGFDPETGRPRQENGVATVSFTHEEQRDHDLTYVTQVDYVVNGGIAAMVQPMTRHITSYEVGLHTTPPDDTHITTPEAAQDQHDERLAAEQAAGLQDVTEAEAEQILQFLQYLQPAQPNN